MREQRFAQRGALLLLPAASHTTQSTMGSGASSAAAAPAKDSKKPVQLLPTHNVQVPSKCARLYFGLSWSAKANIDIDASAVCLAGAQVADIISFQKLRDATPASIVHTGDVLTSGTGTGTSDLERIYVQPELMEKRGEDNLFLVVNVYTQGRTFCDVSSAYARLVHADSDQEPQALSPKFGGGSVSISASARRGSVSAHGPAGGGTGVGSKRMSKQVLNTVSHVPQGGGMRRGSAMAIGDQRPSQSNFPKHDTEDEPITSGQRRRSSRKRHTFADGTASSEVIAAVAAQGAKASSVVTQEILDTVRSCTHVYKIQFEHTVEDLQKQCDSMEDMLSSLM